ncbi:ABC transporter ATP-binding protein [Gloeocapsa sp. PCC 73106]|uniref:ABC transporter ATP-binding protein n=1 Tax=Gloeocapsa sp. PCC 73106 TaxID=102232 RepID=UPI0002AC9F73|nr:ABC transporter ATP-binding protein [Gloeocapsa sp. PCC 73106]ELR97904.1 ABC-type multidrug transport system, ATPase and permease component [Gloeocapsa sp. PCC 73106]
MKYSNLRKLGQYLLPYWRNITIGVIALLMVNAVGIYIPLLIRDGIDKLREAFTYNQLSRYAIMVVILASIMLMIRVFSRRILFGVGRQIEFDLKQKIFEHILTLEPAYFNTRSSGDLISRATSDVDNIRRLVGFSLLSIANTVFAYALTLPVMIAINPSLSLMAISVYPLMVIAVIGFSRKIGMLQMKVQEKIANLSELIQEDVSGMALIKIYAQEEHERRAFARKNKELLKTNLDLARTRNLLFPVIEAISYISLIILLSYGVKIILAGLISIGDFIALILFVERLIFPTALLGFTITSYQSGRVSIERIEAILQVKPQITDSTTVVSLPTERVKGEIKASNFTYSYPGTNKPVLDKLNFTIKAGEMVAIVGSVGAGKSTLANALARLLVVESGQLFLDGIDITQIKLRDLRKAIAIVPQESFLFSTTIRDNIRYGDPLKPESEVEQAAKQAQIHPEILNFPQQYDTVVGERGITLSGGQRQRTSLARALLVDAPILILDDALSSVDNQTASQILDNFVNTQGKTVIFITHQLSAAMNADRLLVMDRGKIVQMGTHRELIQTGGLYQNLWQQHQLEAILQ